MEKETAKKLMAKIDWEIKKQERFFNLINKAETMKPKDRDFILRNAGWVDGTINGTVEYCLRRREKLYRIYLKLYDICSSNN